MAAEMNTDFQLAEKIINIVIRERRLALSDREWKHRLAGYGIGIDDTNDESIIETLPHHKPVCMLPAELHA
ncbi:MAG: hypothetical protein WBC93_12935 [Sulfitobacter sp.]